MTNDKYFRSLLGFAPTSDMVERALIDAELVGTDTYVKSTSSRPLRIAAIDVMETLLTTPDTWQGTGETENRVTFDRLAVEKRIRMLQDELELTVGVPTINGRSVW
jgi:hypothetical protein